MSVYEDEREDDDEENDESFQIKSRAILLTWNIVEEETTFDEFKDWILLNAHEEDEISLCQEKGSHNHFHAYISRSKQICCSIKNYMFLGFKPNCAPNIVKGSGFTNAKNRGHFYVACKYKTTSLITWENYTPNEAYAVKSQWCMDLWQTQKVTDLLGCCAFYLCLTPQIKSVYEVTMNKRKADDKRQGREERIQRLRNSKVPFKVYPEIEEWKAQYEIELDRYNFLILSGPTKVGKTQLAKSLFKNPFTHTDAVCWTGYDDEVHDCIIFDDIKSIYRYVSENKSLFQAGSMARVQTSVTNVYSLEIDVIQKPIIITTNDPPMGPWILGNSISIEILDQTWAEPLELEGQR